MKPRVFTLFLEEKTHTFNPKGIALKAIYIEKVPQAHTSRLFLSLFVLMNKLKQKSKFSITFAALYR